MRKAKEGKKLLPLLCITISAMLLFGCGGISSKKEQAKFDEFIQSDFVEMMESDWLTSHIYLEHPETFGINEDTMEVSLGEVPNKETYEETRESYKELEKEWNQFHREKLTEKQKVIYDTYDFYLELNQNLSKESFDFMNQYFSTLSGVHTQLPTFFSDITLLDENDIEHMLLLMEDTKPYVEDIIEYTDTQAELGYLMIDCDQVRDYCNSIIEEGMNSSVLSNIKETIDQVELSDEKKEEYKAKLEEEFSSSFLSAYEMIADYMETLKNRTDVEIQEDGLWALKNGEKYYEYLFQSATGSDRKVEQTRNLLYHIANDAWEQIMEILEKNPELEEEFYNDEIKTGYTDYQTMLSDLEEKIKEDFPEISNITYEIEPIAEEVANDGVAAYFNIPAIDGTTPKKIRVNESNEEQAIDSISTFKTIAHEGFPGHMYQIQYLYETMEHPWQKVNTNIGFDEGMATYIEFYALKYLENIDEDYLRLYENMEVYSNCVFAILDINIHYDNLTKEEVIDMLSEMGYDEEAINGIYSQLQNNPTAFLSYYVGYAEIIDLKNKAVEKLGDDFNDKQFHEALQKNGSVPFPIIKESVQNYIKEYE